MILGGAFKRERVFFGENTVPNTVVVVLLFLLPWKYNIRKNVNSDLSIVTVRRVAITFSELRVLKNFA